MTTLERGGRSWKVVKDMSKEKKKNIHIVTVLR